MMRAAPAPHYNVLYRFQGTPDGAVANGGLMALDGLLYGTTLAGSRNFCARSCFGDGNLCWEGCGIVFSLDTAGHEQTVYDFRGDLNGAHDGSWPYAGLTQYKGRLYGTTSSGGLFGHGTVYEIDASGHERVIYNFRGDKDRIADGAFPVAPVIVVKNRLYGTTAKGGTVACGGVGCGTIFSLTTSGDARWLYRFGGASQGDGAVAFPGLVALNGNLYGATYEGGRRGGQCGSSGCGTIFEVTLDGQERVVHRFSGGPEGSVPNGLVAVNGVLYGTALTEGAHNEGTFFSFRPPFRLKTLYSFQGKPDAASPEGPLIYSNGNFYGVSQAGGTGGGGGSVFGLGTVFEASASGSEKVLYSFRGRNQGSLPQAPLYLFNGVLYGTTAYGGGSGCHRNGCGTVFSLTP
ncbi:MAG TPA: choice-of-anchor tandem repeat GloVer-containing protein [Candidatus Cybelea sp.]